MPVTDFLLVVFNYKTSRKLDGSLNYKLFGSRSCLFLSLQFYSFIYLLPFRVVAAEFVVVVMIIAALVIFSSNYE